MKKFIFEIERINVVADKATTEISLLVGRKCLISVHTCTSIANPEISVFIQPEMIDKLNIVKFVSNAKCEFWRTSSTDEELEKSGLKPFVKEIAETLGFYFGGDNG
jgi:hypothetical protein